MSTAKSSIRENIEAILIAVILALFIRTFVVQAFKIPSGSMIPTLQIGDHILVSKFKYGVKIPFLRTTLIPITNPKPNDIIVFQFPKDPKVDYIKRVIATGGDIVEIRHQKVYVNGKPFSDSHAVHTGGDHRGDNYGPVTVPAGKLFVMGDNRDNSWDSRFWGFVDLKAVEGKAWLVYFSWDKTKSFLQSIRWSRFGHVVH